VKIHGDLRRNVIGASVVAGLVVAFCFILLGRDPLFFWNDDYELSILPVFADVARSWSEGHLPLLSPYSWVCSNLAGEFQYGTFSVFVNALVVLIWQLPLTFPQQAAALSITHLVVLAIGAFLLARGRMMARPIAIMVALVTALNGWIICWGATDWFGALGAFAWLPWAWWGFERALDARRTALRFLWPAPFVYLLIAGGFPYTVVMMGLLAVWLSVRSIAQTQRLTSAWPMAVGLLLGVSLSAPAWLAVIDYARGSAREVQASLAHFQWLVPPASLPAFVLPCWTVNWADFSTRLLPHTATEMACGLVPPVALLGGILQHPRAFLRRIKWELALLVCVLVISMLPSVHVFRWSFRWLPLLHLVLALCAGEALQCLRARLKDQSGQRLANGFGALAFIFVAIVFAIMVAARTDGPSGFPFSWWMLGLAAAWMFFDLVGSSRFREWLPATICFAALLLTYVWIPANCGVPKYNLDQTLTEVAALDRSRLYLSIYPPPENTYRIEKRGGPIGQIVRPGSTSMWAGLRFINGYSPILAAGVAREFQSAIHGEIGPQAQEQLLKNEADSNGLLATLGVSGIIVANEINLRPLPEREWQLAFSSDEAKVFHRAGSPPARARSLPSRDPRSRDIDFAFASVQPNAIGEARNSDSVEVNVPDGGPTAMIGFSRPYFSGYRASINGRALEVTSFRGLMPVVEVPAGMSGTLRLTYRPGWLLYGFAMAICAGLIWVVGLLFALRSTLAVPRSRRAD
jgi:hypothetical protein